MNSTTIGIIIGVVFLVAVLIGVAVYFIFFRKHTPPSNSPLSQIMINGYVGRQKTVVVCTDCGFQNNPVNIKMSITITSIGDEIGPAKSTILQVFKNYTADGTLGQGTDMNGNPATIFMFDTPAALSSLHHNEAAITGTYTKST